MTTKKQAEYHPPRIAEKQVQLLERLSNACAVSGDEGEVRKIVIEEIKPHVSEYKVDALGNVLAVCRGQTEGRLQAEGRLQTEDRLRVMLAAHMDEVGLMITNDEGDGIYRFEIVGGVEAWKLAGKAVWVGKEHLPGVIGMKPIHLAEKDELQHPVTLDGLRIDTGPEASKIKVGDRATFATPFTRLGSSLRGKALDDRVGVATLIELVRQAPPNIDLLAAFTVQEENGLRGARVAAYALKPDLAIVLDSTPAYDLPSWDGEENTRYNSRLGAGPAIYVADSATLSDPRLVRHLVETAEAYGIPYQVRQPGGGGTDAGAIHRQREGVPSISISVPGRYHHGPASIIHQADWEQTLLLVYAALARLTPAILQAER